MGTSTLPLAQHHQYIPSHVLRAVTVPWAYDSIRQPNVCTGSAGLHPKAGGDKAELRTGAPGVLHRELKVLMVLSFPSCIRECGSPPTTMCKGKAPTQSP